MQVNNWNEYSKRMSELYERELTRVRNKEYAYKWHYAECYGGDGSDEFPEPGKVVTAMVHVIIDSFSPSYSCIDTFFARTNNDDTGIYWEFFYNGGWVDERPEKHLYLYEMAWAEIPTADQEYIYIRKCDESVSDIMMYGLDQNELDEYAMGRDCEREVLDEIASYTPDKNYHCYYHNSFEKERNVTEELPDKWVLGDEDTRN